MWDLEMMDSSQAHEKQTSYTNEGLEVRQESKENEISASRYFITASTCPEHFFSGPFKTFVIEQR